MKIVAALAAAALALQVSAAKKYIFTGWALNDAGPQDVLAYADLFDKTGCDGVGVPLDPSGSPTVMGRLRLTELPRWRDYDPSLILSVCREFARHPSLRHSFFFVNFAPRKERLAWTNDAAWELLADNAATAARIAKDADFEGLIADFEDYWKKRQYRWQAADPAWDEAKALARRRGREVFGGVFRAYPQITILSFQLLTTDTAYASCCDPVAYAEEKRDLWPSFVNGILDALPPTAKLVDGNESFGYTAKASRNDFYRSVRDQTMGVLPLVAEENRAKYRAQLSVSHGLYVDSYAGCSTNSGYYMAPVRGKRITHFEDNLRQATACADEYVWFWGEKGFYIDWPADLKEKSGDVWGSHVGMKWRRKYFEGSWGRIKPWNETLDGNFDLILRGVKDPARCVCEEYAKQKTDGSFKDLFAAMKLTVATNGNASVFMRQMKFETDGWYGLRVKGRGEVVRGTVYFQHNGSWRWNLGSVRFYFDKADAEGWRDGAALVRIPDGANNLYVLLDAGKDEKVRPVAFRDFESFRIK